jgi:hypothetical protein
VLTFGRCLLTAKYGKYKGKGDINDIANYDIIYNITYYRREMKVLLSKNDIDEHIEELLMGKLRLI